MTEPRLVGSFPRADVSLDPPLPEIALVGRSNVGKSSLLNALLGRRLARVSATPGKTRMLNVYQVPGAESPGVTRGAQATEHDGAATSRSAGAPLRAPCYLLDLPGYGWARASRADRTAFSRLVRHVLHRPRLAGVVWLLDIRHEPSAGDRDMQDLLAAGQAPVLAAITKSDKVPRARRQERLAALQAATGLGSEQVVLTSARAREGTGELGLAIAALVREARP